MRLLLFIVALGGAVVAPAQSPPKPADSRTRVEVAVFTRCLVDNRRQEARRAVLEDWDSRSFVYRELLKERSCYRLGRGFRASASVLRENLAGHLIAGDLGPTDVGRIGLAPALRYPAPEPLRTVDAKGRSIGAASIERQQEAIQRKLTWTSIARFGECVVRANPVAVPALAASPVASDAELQALKAFGPHLPSCLPPNARLELDRSTLRGAILLAYYRLAMAARGASTQGASK